MNNINKKYIHGNSQGSVFTYHEPDDLDLQKHLTFVKDYLKKNGVNNFIVVASKDKNSKGHSVTYNNGNEVIKKLRETLEGLEIESGEDPKYDWSK